MYLFQKLFNLHPGEGRSASLFLILGFVWSLGAFGGLTLSEGMFLEHVGAKHLPASYLVTAGCLCLLATLLLWAIHRLSIAHLLFFAIAGVLTLQLLLYLSLALEIQLPFFWYLFKIIGWISPVAIYICFWAFVDQYYDLQDAKRCFCLFNSVLYLGDACGGAVISYAIESLGFQGIILFFSVCLFLSLPLIYLIVKRRRPVPEENREGDAPKNVPSLLTLLGKIARSPFTLILMLFYFLMQLIVITTEYTYMDAFEKAFASANHPYTLTEFLGKLALWVSLGNMFFGLFFYSRTVTRIGVNNIILIAPLFFLSIFFCWSWFETLSLALLALIAREGMSYTFDDNNLLLLIAGVPTKIKNQVRIAIESFFEPIGMLTGAALLFLLQNQSKFLGLAISLVALCIVILLRSQYGKALFHNLMDHSIHFEKKASDWIAGFTKKERKKIEISLLANLKKNDETLQLLAFEYLLKMENASLLARLLHQANRFSIRGKLRVIELLSASPFACETLLLERLEQWHKMLPHPTIRMAITFYFASHKLARLSQLMPYLDSEHLLLRGSAILTLKTFPEKVAHSLLALEKLKTLLHSSEEKEICMGLMILGKEKRGDNLRELFPFLKHSSPAVGREAAIALAACAEPSEKAFVAPLIAHVMQTTDRTVQEHCLTAIEKIGVQDSILDLILAGHHVRHTLCNRIERMIGDLGKETLPTLLAILQDERVHLHSRLLAGKILGTLSPPDLHALLKPLVATEIGKAHFYFYHAKHVHKMTVAGVDFSIVENALTTTFKATLDFVIQLLALGGGIEECEVLSGAIGSKNRKIRAHALETLEKSSDPSLFVLLKPFLDERHVETLLTLYLKKGANPLTLEGLLEHLEHSPTHANRVVSYTLKERIQEAKLT